MEKNEQLEMMRHSGAHIMAAAALELWPEVKLAIGPAIDNGFYYDFDFGDQKIGEDDFAKLEKKMIHLAKQNLKFESREVDIEEAIEKEKEAGQVYKVELLEDLKKDGESKVTYYKLGNFDDLCRGPHIESSGKIKKGTFKIDKIAGAYWRGDEKNKMLTRLYCLLFETAEELNEYIKMREEAKSRDHRKLGKELDLFCFSDLVGPGLPMYTPKGTSIVEALQFEVERICRKHDVEKVMAPHIAKIDLYKASGHADKFSDELLRVEGHYKQELVLKPVQCPHHTQIYASRPRSYRDLPIRYMESNKQYRDEKPGEIGGLTRVIAITIEDGHTFCTVDQIKEEAKTLVEIIKEFYQSVSLWGNHWVSLSVRDYDHPENYIGEAKDWDKAEAMLQEISDDLQLDAKKMEGEAALYGPKLDFMFEDALGNERQLATVQLDFATPTRFNLVYTDKSGKEVHPVMVHRAILGSYERFLAILIEHFAGAFPLWLSPVQVKLISVGEGHIDFCKNLAKEFKEVGIKVEVDDNDETVGNKIRKATGEKVPYMLVIGDKEMESENLMVRDRGSRDTREISKADFIKEIMNKIENKS